MACVAMVLVAGFLSSLQHIPVSALCSSDFEGENDYPYKHFTVYTLYDTVRGNISRKDRPDGCSPKAIAMFLRHGSRHPGSRDVDKFQALVDLAQKVNSSGNAELCSKDLERIRNWNVWYKPSLDMDLAVTGIAEMRDIANRYSYVFPELFSEETKYRFISSDKKRNKQSAEAFKEGISGIVTSNIEIDNRLTRFYTHCEKYWKEIYSNKTLVEDVTAFLEGPVISAVADKFSSRLGIPRSEVSNDLVNSVKTEGCAKEEWATGNDSAWCLAFTKQDLGTFEYAEDMDAYLVRSFGKELIHKQSCVTKNFLLSTLQNATSSDSPSAVFLFSHYTPLLSLLAELRVMQNDGPFSSSDYPAKLNRTFRASLLAPGSGNIAFILYECAGEMKIQIFLNEVLVRMPLDDPSEDGLWSFESALQYFGFNDPRDCLFDDMCFYQSPVTDDPDGVTMTSSSSPTLQSSMRIGLVVVVAHTILSYLWDY